MAQVGCNIITKTWPTFHNEKCKERKKQGKNGSRLKVRTASTALTTFSQNKILVLTFANKQNKLDKARNGMK